MNPEQRFAQHLSSSEIDRLKDTGMSGIVRIGGFEAEFESFETGDRVTVNLTSAAIWLVVVGDEQDYVYFVQQADRVLENGKHPWEVPSGHVDPSDEDIFHTAKREVLEETGIVIQQVYPISVAIKRDQQDIPPIVMVPSYKNDIWIYNEGEMFKKNADSLVGGLICVSTVQLNAVSGLEGLRKLPFDSGDNIGGRLFRTPPRVDKDEISRFVLEPLDIVMSGQSNFIPKTGHMWAQADAFRAFTLKMNSV